MITRQQAFDDQNDLDALCKDHSQATSERFEPAAWYGNSMALREYASIREPLDYVVPHGIALHSWIWKNEIDAGLPAYIYQTNRLPLYRQRFSKVIHGAAPFLYALALVGDPPTERRGTIFFPAHSTHHARVNMDIDALADKAANLPAEFQPVAVCIYWRGHLLGDDQPYKRSGLRIVSAGHMFDEQFAYRLAYLLQAHKYAASNDIGTQLFFSVAAGCSFFHIPHEFGFSGPREDFVNDAVVSKPPEMMTYFEQLFSERRERMTTEQIGVVDEYISRSQFKAPDALRRELKR